MKHTMQAALVAALLMPWPLTGLASLVTPVSSEVKLRAEVKLTGIGDAETEDGKSQAATLDTLSAEAIASVAGQNASIQAQAKGEASWNDSDSGTVSLYDIGWSTSNVSDGSATLRGGTDWSYQFVANNDAIFQLDYDITGTGDLYGLNGFFFSFRPLSELPSYDFLDLDNSRGSITKALIAGEMYSVFVNNEANIGWGLGTRVAEMDGWFNWQITPAAAPEGGVPLGLILMSWLGLAVFKRANRT